MGFAFPEIQAIVAAQQMSIVLEVSGEPKPGNVTRHGGLPEMSYDDFLSAAVSVEDPLVRYYERARRMSERGKGSGGLWGLALLESCHAAMCGRPNTIFGTLLVEIPLGLGASLVGASGSVIKEAARIVQASDFRDSLAFVKSVRLCRVGGLSHAAFVRSPESLDLEDPSVEQQVKRKRVGLAGLLAPSVGYDLLAAELVGGFPIIRRYGAEFVAWLRRLEDPVKASAATFCSLLASYPDSLVGRKAGREVAEGVRARAQKIMEHDPFSLAWLEGMERLDRDLRARDLNPGTLADLTAASIFLALLGEVARPAA